MSKTQRVRTGIVWFASIALAALVTWHVAISRVSSRGQLSADQTGDSVEATPRVEQQEQDLDDKLNALMRENASLREELARLRAEYDNAIGAHIKRALLDALRSAVDQAETEQQVPLTWQEGFRSLQNAGRGYASIDEAINLIVDMLLLGEPAVEALAEVARDAEYSMEEREMAVGCLTYTPHAAALDALMDVQNSELTGDRFEYDLIKRQVAKLPTADIERHISTINDHIAQQLGQDQDTDRPEVLACLAFIHEDATALSLIRDRRMRDERLRGALTIAETVHTEDAKRFVEEARRGSVFDDVRDAATRILEEW